MVLVCHYTVDFAGVNWPFVHGDSELF